MKETSWVFYELSRNDGKYFPVTKHFTFNTDGAKWFTEQDINEILNKNDILLYIFINNNISVADDNDLKRCIAFYVNPEKITQKEFEDALSHDCTGNFTCLHIKTFREFEFANIVS